MSTVSQGEIFKLLCSTSGLKPNDFQFIAETINNIHISNHSDPKQLLTYKNQFW